MPLTTQLDALRFPGTTLVEADAKNGLPRNCVALVFQLTAVDQRQVQTSPGSVSSSVLEAIRTALDEITGAN